MLYLFIKAAVSGVIVAIVSKVARRSPGIGALVVSLPLVSLLAIIGLWRDTPDVERVAAHCAGNVLVRVAEPAAVPRPAGAASPGAGLWSALAASSLLTIVLYLGMIWLLTRSGLSSRRASAMAAPCGRQVMSGVPVETLDPTRHRPILGAIVWRWSGR